MGWYAVPPTFLNKARGLLSGLILATLLVVTGVVGLLTFGVVGDMDPLLACSNSRSGEEACEANILTCDVGDCGGLIDVTSRALSRGEPIPLLVKGYKSSLFEVSCLNIRAHEIVSAVSKIMTPAKYRIEYNLSSNSPQLEPLSAQTIKSLHAPLLTSVIPNANVNEYRTRHNIYSAM